MCNVPADRPTPMHETHQPGCGVVGVGVGEKAGWSSDLRVPLRGNVTQWRMLLSPTRTLTQNKSKAHLSPTTQLLQRCRDPSIHTIHSSQLYTPIFSSETHTPLTSFTPVGWTAQSTQGHAGSKETLNVGSEPQAGLGCPRKNHGPRGQLGLLQGI